MSQVEELGDNRVRLRVDVPPHDIRHAVDHAASDLAESVKIPGFRKGKVPRPVLLSRIGKERLFAEAVDSHIGGWFLSAAARSRLRPVSPPHYEYALPERDDAGWSFTATVEVQPTPEIVDWTTLDVPRAEPEVPEELVQQELDALRETIAELAPVEGRPAQEGDTVVVDIEGAGGQRQSDTVVELGSGRLVDEIETALVGASPGETRTVRYELADGAETTVDVTVKHVSEKVLPEIDDDLARSATEFDTLAELRADVEGRVREQLEREIEAAFRAAAVDRLVEASRIEPAGPLVESRARELLTGFVRSLERRGIQPETYFSVTGQSPEALTAQIRAEAAQSVARELALEAVAERAGIQVPDDEVEAFLREGADEEGEDADALVEAVRAHGEFERLREDLRLRGALDRLASEVKPISTELAEARERLWTPEKERPETETTLWTPGSKERE